MSQQLFARVVVYEESYRPIFFNCYKIENTAEGIEAFKNKTLNNTPQAHHANLYDARTGKLVKHVRFAEKA